jgi:hypothetical protein
MSMVIRCKVFILFVAVSSSSGVHAQDAAKTAIPIVRATTEAQVQWPNLDVLDDYENWYGTTCGLDGAATKPEMARLNQLKNRLPFAVQRRLRGGRVR